MSVKLSCLAGAGWQFFDNNGVPLAGGLIYTYAAGTTTPQATYTSVSGAVANPNPIVLDAAGRVDGEIWLTEGVAYKFILKTATDVLLGTYDDISGINDFGDIFAEFANTSDVALGDALIGFEQSNASGLLPNAVPKTVHDKFQEFVSVDDFIPKGTNTKVTDCTQYFQNAVNYAITLAEELTSGGEYQSSAFITVKLANKAYLLSQTNGVTIPVNTYKANICFEADYGATLIGNLTNIGINFNGGGYKNRFRKILFTKFGTAVKLNTSNNNESMLQVESCQSLGNDIFLDTVSYATSRSTMIDIRDTFCGDTRVFVKHYTDHMTIRDCWMYAKNNSYDAVLYLSGDGNVNLYDNFFIPFGAQISNPQNARWIDFVSDSAQGTSSDRSVKFLNIRGCRCSLESARPFIWTYDDQPAQQPNAISSITIEDSYIGGTGGASVITYKTGYPGSVNLKNCKVLSSYNIVGVDASNSTYPRPSTAIGSSYSVTNHVIMVDEATRLSQNNVYTTNLGDLIDPKLMPFYYDTTTQTSKYKTTFPWQVPSDYRMAAVEASAGNVKVEFPIFFDFNPAVPNRDICSFILVTVSDAQVGGASGVYRAQATSLVTVVGLYSAPNDVKKLIVTTLQDAKGGINGTQSAVPAIFWGSGNTGSDTVVYTGAGNPEEAITVVWPGSNAAVCWAYLVPLSGIRPNQPSLKQYDNW